jgi:hypothetical protein
MAASVPVKSSQELRKHYRTRTSRAKSLGRQSYWEDEDMEELNTSIEGLAALVDELIALLPEEPETELDLKAAELAARVVEHLALIDALAGRAGRGRDGRRHRRGRGRRGLTRLTGD